MNDPTNLDENSLGAVFELLSQASNAGGPPLAAIVAEGRRRRRARRVRQGLAAGTALVVVGGGGWLVGETTASPTVVTAVAGPATSGPSRPAASPTSSSSTPHYTMFETFPQWSGTISGVHWTLGVAHPGGGDSCTAVVAGVGRVTGDAAIFGCDQGPVEPVGGVGTTGFQISAPSGHGYVGFVTIGQVNKAVKTVDCLWKGVHQTVPTFRIKGLNQTYFAVGVPDTSVNPTNPSCTLLDAQGKNVGRV